MKTEARCPTCDYPFSFWRLVFLYSPFHFYCKSCGWRIVIGKDKTFMYSAMAAIAVISVILFNFIIARDMKRLLILGAIWLVSFYIVEIIISLLIVNVAEFYKPEESDGEDE